MRPLLLALIAFFAALPAMAQPAWPDRPLRFVVPYAAGGTTDVVARSFAETMARELGQPIVVEARPGGGTNIAAALVARAQPDGGTFFITNIASNVLNQALYRRLEYDPNSFAHAGIMTRGTICLLVGPASPMRSMAALLAEGRRRPGGLSYASNGIGTPTHLMGEMLRQRTGLTLTHVPYGGSSQASVDVMAGRVDFSFDACTPPNADRILGVAYAERWPDMPQLPTMAEQGLPGLELTTFFGLAGPQGTPAPVLARLEQAMLLAAADPALRQRVAPTGFIVAPLNRAETEAFLAREVASWSAVVRGAGLVLE